MAFFIPLITERIHSNKKGLSDLVPGATVASGGKPECLAPQLGICKVTLHQFPCYIVELT